MKLVKNFLLFAIAVGLTAGCGEDPMSKTESAAETAVEHAIKHLDPTYICPMHPQIVRNEPGDCPICGMALVEKAPEPAVGSSAGAERKILYYRHPHNPGITSDVPRKDEMGMDFVPIYDDGDATAVRISPAVIQNMGVRTAAVSRAALARRIDTVGYVDYDESRMAHIHLRTDGWIEKLAVEAEGERVASKQKLFELYSPSLVTAQQEYLQALELNKQRLADASKDRLVTLGMSAGQIARIAKTRRALQRITVFAPQDGVVSTLNIREGMYVKPATVVMSLADLASVWVLAEVFERQAAWVQPGQAASVRFAFAPGQTWQGQVDYVYPTLDARTRTLKVRLRFANADEIFKPNMYGNVTIEGGGKQDALHIPREALIRTGKDERVILDMGEGRFKARSVVTGMESGDLVEIVAGLEEGDRVVISGQFLIDSEASLKATLMRMREGDDRGAQTGMGQ